MSSVGLRPYDSIYCLSILDKQLEAPEYRSSDANIWSLLLYGTGVAVGAGATPVQFDAEIGFAHDLWSSYSNSIRNYAHTPRRIHSNIERYQIWAYISLCENILAHTLTQIGPDYLLTKNILQNSYPVRELARAWSEARGAKLKSAVSSLRSSSFRVWKCLSSVEFDAGLELRSCPNSIPYDSNDTQYRIHRFKQYRIQNRTKESFKTEKL